MPRKQELKVCSLGRECPNPKFCPLDHSNAKNRCPFANKCKYRFSTCGFYHPSYDFRRDICPEEGYCCGIYQANQPKDFVPTCTKMHILNSCQGSRLQGDTRCAYGKFCPSLYPGNLKTVCLHEHF